MTTKRLALKLAGAAMAAASAAMAVTGFAGLGPPLGLENWGLVLAAICGGVSAIFFIAADGPSAA